MITHVLAVHTKGAAAGAYRNSSFLVIRSVAAARSGVKSITAVKGAPTVVGPKSYFNLISIDPDI